MTKPGDITQLLQDWAQGDEEALNQLMLQVYDELQRLATSYLRRERSDHTLQPAALVHEAYLRLVDQRRVRWQNRSHFYGIAAQMMRRVLTNHARDRVSAKRGGGAEHLPLDEALAGSDDPWTEYLAVDEALGSLASVSPEQAKIMELFYFGGLSREEIADIVDISVPTVARRLRIARAWLYRQIHGAEAAP